MIIVTPAAVACLKTLILQHPEDPVIRIELKDLDEVRLLLSITLEDVARPDDRVQHVDGLTVAVEAQSAPRVSGAKLDYEEEQGFRLLHPAPEDELKLDLLNLN